MKAVGGASFLFALSLLCDNVLQGFPLFHGKADGVLDTHGLLDHRPALQCAVGGSELPLRLEEAVHAGAAWAAFFIYFEHEPVDHRVQDDIGQALDFA